MSIPTSQSLPPEDFDSMSPTRRRRRRRMIFPGASDQQSAFIEELAHRALPSADLFLFAFLSVIILGSAILLDSPALFILAALFAPFIAPIFGLALATATGTKSFFFQSLGGLIFACLIYFLGGMGSGWVASILWKDMPVVPTQVYFHTVFSWPDMVVLAVGAVLTASFLMKNNSQTSLLSSVALAYEILLPVGVAGFGLTSGVNGLFPNALLIFITYLLIAVLLSIFVMALMGVRPRNRWGFTIITTIGMGTIVFLIGLNNMGPISFKTHPVSAAPTQMKPLSSFTPTPTASITDFVTDTLTATPQISFTNTLAGPTIKLTPTHTLVPTPTISPTSSPAPTPVYARINVKGGAGALVREKPDANSAVVKSVLNETVVEILPDDNVNGWIKVRLMPDGAEGWVLHYLAITATPQS